MSETDSIPEPEFAAQAAQAAAPSPTPAPFKRPVRRFPLFLTVAILVLAGGAMLLTVQWLRTRGMLQQEVAAIARDVAVLKNQNDVLDARIAMLEKSAAETQSAGGGLADLNMRLAAMEAELSHSADRDSLAQLQARLARLESASPGEMFRTAAAALARANLARAAEGSSPLNAELAALRATAPDEPALAVIAPIAPTGASTRTVLIERFPVVARAALAAEQASDPDAGFFARLWASLRGLVRVRRVSDIAGATTEARLARAQADCDRGDLAGAAIETRGVSGRAAAPLQSWLADVDARLALDGAVADMNQRFLRAPDTVSGAAPSTATGTAGP